MSNLRRVLLIEDEDLVAKSIKCFLDQSSEFVFEVSIVRDVVTYAREHYDKNYDIYIVDLNLDGRNRADEMLFLGHLIVSIRHFERPDSLIVVYSAHAELEHVVCAMRHGATDFAAKAQTSVAELVLRIEQALTEQRVASKERQRIVSLVERNAFGWRATYAGKVIVVVDENIVASGENRLEALLAYRNLCLLPEGGDLPLDPVVLEVPPMPESVSMGTLHVSYARSSDEEDCR